MDNRDQGVKMEDPMRSSSFFDYYYTGSNPSTSFLDYAINEGEKGSLGFMELLDFGSSGSSLFQSTADQISLSPAKADSGYTPAVAPESPERINAPATPNSSSISSESSGALPVNDESSKPTDEEEEQHKTKKHLKPKKTNQKRQREPRFAFMTKSEVDHLEDGYRWRKYGQKAVKNSPFPRSYYRCTHASCNVKKRVERSFNDPSVVVTTYEGQHTHPSPMMHRPSPAAGGLSQAHAQTPAGFFSGYPMQITLPQQLQLNSLAMAPFNCGLTSYRNFNLAGGFEGQFCSTSSPVLLRNDGLLQDIVPSTMRNEE